MDNNQAQNQSNSLQTPTDTPTQQTPPVMSMDNTAPNIQNKSSAGSVIATIIIIAVIILGGLYFWGKRIETQKIEQAMIQTDGTTTNETAAAVEATRIETVSQDDSLNVLESEIKTTNTADLSAELK